MFHSRNRCLRSAAIAVMALGSCYQILGCGLSDLTSYVANFNPCGTILLCDPVAYEFNMSGYDGPGVDPDIDPACTYPPYCNIPIANPDPFSPSPTLPF